MGVIAETIRSLRPAVNVTAPFSPVQTWQGQRAQLNPAKYSTYAKEGYQGNDIVFACIEELSSSASEPTLHARVRGGSWTPDTGIIDLLTQPNPFMDHYDFWSTVIMHRTLAGNAYALKVRSRSGKVIQLWLLRPDRVQIVPSQTDYIARYEYSFGTGEWMPLPVEDVIHFKTRHPLDDYYGMPPLMPIGGWTDIDNFMRDFVKTYFDHAGIPGGMLNVKAKMNDLQKEEIRKRYRDHGGPSGWHELMIIDNTDASFTQMTANLGNQGLVVPELTKIAEARITNGLGVPHELIGTLIGEGSSSYDAKRAAREQFWNETLRPLYRELVGPLNMRLVPDFPRVTEVAFDLSQVGALQEDDDKKHARVREDLNAGLISLEEARDATGYGAAPIIGTYFIPTQVEAMPAERIGEKPEPMALPPAPEPQPAGANGNGRA